MQLLELLPIFSNLIMVSRSFQFLFFRLLSTQSCKRCCLVCGATSAWENYLNLPTQRSHRRLKDFDFRTTYLFCFLRNSNCNDYWLIHSSLHLNYAAESFKGKLYICEESCCTRNMHDCNYFPLNLFPICIRILD